MKPVLGLIMIVFGALWGVAGIMGFIAGSIGPGAIQLLIGAVFIALGQKLRSNPATLEGDDSEPQ